VQRRAHAFYIDALAQLGRMWKVAPKQAGARGRKGGGQRKRGKPVGLSHGTPQPKTRKELGLTDKTVRVAVKLAELPTEQV
jgi:hypothetical protein